MSITADTTQAFEDFIKAAATATLTLFATPEWKHLMAELRGSKSEEVADVARAYLGPEPAPVLVWRDKEAAEAMGWAIYDVRRQAKTEPRSSELARAALTALTPFLTARDATVWMRACEAMREQAARPDTETQK